jgi:hypothetical protein
MTQSDLIIPPTQTGYIIMTINYEYNDEVYYQGEGGGGNPVKVFRDKLRAEERCRQLNVEAFRDHFVTEKFYGREPTPGTGYRSSPAEYCYDINDLFKSHIAPEEAAVSWNFDLDTPYRFMLPLDITDERLADFVDDCAISFYTVAEAELEV